MRVIYHLANRADWEVARASNVYAPANVTENQPILYVGADHYVALANALFASRTDLLLLFIDTQHLPQPLHATTVSGVPAFLGFSPLPRAAVFEVADMLLGPAGHFIGHHETGALSIHADDALADVHARALHIMRGFDRPWWVAGGWAIDLFVGMQTRPHADLEISVLATDQTALHAHLHEWDLRIAAPGAAFVPWTGQPLTPPYHQIWARQGTEPATTPEEFSADPTMVDFLIERHEGDVWYYRRDRRIWRRVDEVGTAHDRLPYVRPEIALLYKAKDPRYKDQRDFEHLTRLLGAQAQQWLRDALTLVAANHPWISQLR